jgi:hypothetical protein
LGIDEKGYPRHTRALIGIAPKTYRDGTSDGCLT